MNDFRYSQVKDGTETAFGESSGGGWIALSEYPVSVSDLDASVAEVFESMLGMACVPCASGVVGGERVSATIVLRGGAIAGRCVVELPAEAGDWLTDTMMASQADWDEEMIRDAVGELCNMITGGVKRRLRGWIGECRVSLPAVSRVRVAREEVSGIRRFYRVGDTTLPVRLEFWRRF